MSVNHRFHCTCLCRVTCVYLLWALFQFCFCQQHTHIVLHTANTNLYIQQWMSIAYYYGDILLPSACCTYTYNYAYCCLGSVICMILAAECCSNLWWLLCVAYTSIHVSLRTCGYEQYVCVVVCVLLQLALNPRKWCSLSLQLYMFLSFRTVMRSSFLLLALFF